MARKSIVLPDENFKCRNFRLEIYEEWEADIDNGYLDFCDIISNIRKYSRFIGIRHDKDEWTYSDYQSRSEYMDSHNIHVGDLKKPHYHFVVKFENARFRDTVAKEIGMNSRFIFPCNKYQKAVEYLIHLNEDDKHLYDVSECFGTLVPDLKKFLSKRINEEDRSNMILDIILSKEHWLLVDLLHEINNQGLYGTFRQGWSIYRQIIEDHNLGIY